VARDDSLSQVGVGSTAVETRVGTFLRGVYGWMAVGLALTAVVAFWVASSNWIGFLGAHRWVLLALFVAQIGVVITLSAGASRIAPGVATALFLGYSALTGVTLSLILLVYTRESIASTFFITAGMFGALALYGSTTARSLASWGSFLFMGLIGVVLASVVGLFWQNDALQFLIGFVGVIVFTGLTAYDAQRLKAMALALPEGQVGSYTIVGALSLYLNFVNLFLSLLRFTGGRRS